MRYFYVFDGKRVYDIDKARIRIKILLELLKMEGNMEVVAPIFEESNGKVQITEWEYLKEIRGEVYYCYNNCKTGKTFRSYYSFDDPRFIEGNNGDYFLEIVSMKGKQLIAKDV